MRTLTLSELDLVSGGAQVVVGGTGVIQAQVSSVGLPVVAGAASAFNHGHNHGHSTRHSSSITSYVFAATGTSPTGLTFSNAESQAFSSGMGIQLI
jgi:hypothetical protein